MLTLKTLRDNPELVIKKLGVKHFDAHAIVAEVIALDDRRKAIQQESDALLGQQKKAAAAIGQLMKEGKRRKSPPSRLAPRNSWQRPTPTPPPCRTHWSCCPTSPVTWSRREPARRTTWW